MEFAGFDDTRYRVSRSECREQTKLRGPSRSARLRVYRGNLQAICGPKNYDKSPQKRSTLCLTVQASGVSDGLRRNFPKSQFPGHREVKITMKRFVIDPANGTKVYASSQAARQCLNGVPFATEKEFASIAAEWPMLRLVAIWNKLPGLKPVSRFKDRSTALRRIWAALQVLVPGTGTKKELVIGLLKQPSGTSLKEIMAATGWQAHTVRGFIAAQLSKRFGFRVLSFKRQGERAYRLLKTI